MSFDPSLPTLPAAATGGRLGEFVRGACEPDAAPIEAGAATVSVGV